MFIGGELIFDEKDIELFADNILLVEGGKLQVLYNIIHLPLNGDLQRNQ